MMFENVNLEKALLRQREDRLRKMEQEVVMNEFKSLFEAEWEREKRIATTLEVGASGVDLLQPEGLDESRIYQLGDIRQLCVKYRLRFLSTRHFKNDFPLEAVSAIKRTEATAKTEIKSFMIAAPAGMFHLQDVNKDPLLFAPLEDGRFYLIHKWGSDLKWYRRALHWPVEKLQNLLISVLTVSLLLAALFPTGLLTTYEASYFNFYRAAFFVWNVVFFSSMVSYFWFATHRKFSVNAWNSKTFN